MNLPKNLPGLLRAAGLTVVEVDDWQTRGRPATVGGFSPVGVLNHHTGASAKLWSNARRLEYAKWMFLTGRPDLPAPLCHIALDPGGVVYIGAAGRANHAGKANASGSVAAGDGNELYVGVEWMLSGTESIPAVMMAAGATLNAVLTAKVTKTSTASVSCHYQTSTTGKWDIGDPNGIEFLGKKVLDVPKFRRAVDAERVRLYDSPSTGRAPVLHLGHISLQYSDSEAQWAYDVATVFRRQYDWFTGTEAGENSRWAIVKRAAKRRGYRVWRYKSNFIAVKKSIIKGRVTRGVQTVIDKELVAGPGHDSNYLWVQFECARPGVGTVAVLASHYPTKGRPGAKAPNNRNARWTRLMGRVISAKAGELGKGARLAFYGGDQNLPDNIYDTFFGGPLTSCWDELGKHPDTGHGNIDVIASHDRDARVKCVGARALNDEKLFLYSDHFLIEASYRVGA